MQPERSELSVVILGNGIGFNYALIGTNKLIAIEVLLYSDIFETFHKPTQETNLLMIKHMRNVLNGNAIQQNLSSLRLVEVLDQRDDRGFATA